MSRYDHKIETSLEGIEHLSKENRILIKTEITKESEEKMNKSLINSQNKGKQGLQQRRQPTTTIWKQETTDRNYWQIKENKTRNHQRIKE